MAFPFLDSRQTEYRQTLQTLFPWVPAQTLDVLLASINADVTPPLMVTATATPSLTVDVGGTTVSNPESNRQKSISFINNLIPSLASGSYTFPSSSGGDIVSSTGGSVPLTLPSGDYCAVLLSLDDVGNLDSIPGTPAPSAAACVVPPPDSNTLPFAYVILQNLGGTIQPVTQSVIFQIQGGGGGGSSSGGGAAQETPLTIGTTTETITFASPRSDANYTLICQMVNVTDPNPQFQPITIVSKTSTGFTIDWNGALDTSNYLVDWVVAPGVSVQAGEFTLSSGSTSVTISFPIAFTNTNYVVICGLDNYTDSTPQFQPLLVTNKSLDSFMVNWNGPLNDANYRLSWFVGAYQ